MNFDLFFRRLGNDWKQFAMMGLGPLLVTLGTGLVMTVAGLALLGPGIFQMIRAERMGGVGSGAFFSFFGSFAGFLVVALVVAVVSGALTYGGLIGTVIGYRRGEQPSLASFWEHATRNLSKMILLGLALAGIHLLVMIPSVILMFIPVLGWIAIILLQVGILLHLGLYPAYLIIAEGRDLGQALSVGLTVIKSHLPEALLATVFFWGFGMAVGIVGAVPLIGWIVALLFAQPVITFFFIERFELEVRPKLGI